MQDRLVMTLERLKKLGHIFILRKITGLVKDQVGRMFY
ncbi:hypothetical protein MIDIC_330013 [Alphaproteobacteria bacterium]